MKVFRGKIKLIKPVSTCGYCDSYNYSNIRSKEGRFCKIANCFQISSSQTCEDFNLYPIFYCKRCNARLDIEICLSRQKNQKEGCVSCSQGKRIIQFAKKSLEDHQCQDTKETQN